MLIKKPSDLSHSMVNLFAELIQSDWYLQPSSLLTPLTYQLVCISIEVRTVVKWLVFEQAWEHTLNLRCVSVYHLISKPLSVFTVCIVQQRHVLYHLRELSSLFAYTISRQSVPDVDVTSRRALVCRYDRLVPCVHSVVLSVRVSVYLS